MRPVQAWLLIAAVGIGVVIGIRLNTESRPDLSSGATASTTASSAAVGEFVRLQDDRIRSFSDAVQP